MRLLHNISIKNKLIALIVAVSLVSIVIGFSVIMVKDILQLRKDLVNKIRLDASLVGEYCISPLSFTGKSGVAEVLEKMRAMPDIENGFVYDEKGELYGSYHKGKNIMAPPPPPQEPMAHFQGDYLVVARIIYYKNFKFGAIYVRASTALMAETIRVRILWLALIMAGVILIAYVLAFRFQSLISLPILTLANVTKRISHDIDYSIRVKRLERDEIGVLYDGFNTMLEKIQLWEKKRDEAEAEQQRLLVELEAKNKELEQVVYVASHDLRSPLVNIQGFGQELSYSIKEVDTLLHGLETTSNDRKAEISAILREDVLESLKFIQSSTAKMDGLLSGLLRLSRIGRVSTTFELIDMNRLVLEVSHAFEFHLKEAGGTLTVENLPSCFGCELEINQVFSNLINNAIKYRDPKRALQIKISGSVTQSGKSAVYGVEDNGIGIPREYQDKIFQIFHRLRPDDTDGEGLGLAIVLKIVQQHNGKVAVESTLGKGSCFLITLPAFNVQA